MLKKEKNSEKFLELEELELPQLEEHVKGIQLPDLDENGKCVLKNIPDFDFDEKRSIQGYLTYISLFSGSTGSNKDGWKGASTKAGSIYMNNKTGSIRISYLDFYKLLELVGQHLDFVKFQVLRTRADIKEEIARKSAYLE